MANVKAGGVYIEVQAKMDRLESDLRSIEARMKSTDNIGGQLSSTFKKIVAGAALYKIAGALKDTLHYASQLQETTNKFNVVFKSALPQAQKYADVLINGYGMATEEAMRFLANTGDILTGLGMTAEAALEVSNQVTQLGTDLASFSNVEGGATRAIGAITSALTGEREALKAYGIVINEEMIQERLAAEGKDKLTGAALNQAKAEATVAIAYEQSKNAIGDMARSFDSYANIQRRVESRMNDIQASIGEDMLPAVSNLGLAFLSASKDGGILSSALHTITKFIADVINGVALLIAHLDTLSSESALDEYSKNVSTNAELNKKTIKEYGSYAELQAKARTDAVAAEKLAQYEINKQAIIRDTELANKEKKIYDEKLNAVETIQNRIKNSDQVLAAEQEQIAKREKERDNEKSERNKKQTAEQKKQLEQQKKDIEEYGSVAAAALIKPIESASKKWKEYGGIALGLTSQLSEVMSLYSSNETMRVENDTNKKLESLQTTYDAQIAAVEAEVISDSEKAAKKKAIDEQYARDKEALEASTEKKKRKIAREQAKLSRDLSLFETIITTPQAAMDAFASLAKIPFVGFALGTAAAAATTALGIAKAKLISDQPLPALALGGIVPAVPGGRQVTVAEAGSAEAVIPLNGQGIDVLRQAISQAGGGGVTNIYLDSELIYSSLYADSRNGKVKIDRRALVA